MKALPQTASGSSDREFANGWKVLLAGMLGVTCGASPIPFNLIGFTVEPLSAEFGWSRTEIILPATIYGLIASLMAPVFGWLQIVTGCAGLHSVRCLRLPWPFRRWR